MKAILSPYLVQSSLISPNLTYRIPDDVRIEYVLEEFGYDKFLPKTLLYCLLSAASYTELCDEHFTVTTVQDELIRELLLEVPYNIYEGSPLEKAVGAIVDLSETINFRKFENGEGAFKERSDNAVHSIEDLEEEDLDIVKSVYGNNNEKSIKDFIIAIKNFDFGAREAQETVTKFKRTRMKSYNQIAKINMSKFARPDFKCKFALQDFSIKHQEKNIEKVNRKLIMIRDASLSMKKYSGVLRGILSVIAKTDRELYLHTMFAGGSEMAYLADGENIHKYAKELQTFIPGYMTEFSLEVTRILSIYSKEDLEVIILTDGTESLSKSLVKTKAKFHIVNVDVENTSLEFLTKRTKGKYFMLKDGNNL